MNVLKKLIRTENRKFLSLSIILVASLIFSAVIYLAAGNGKITKINYESISKMRYSEIFLMTIKRNLLYFVAIVVLTMIGRGSIINILFGIVCVYYGLSAIYLNRTLKMDTAYFIMTFADYFVFFPILFYFTFISASVSKYTKKIKNIETISHKFDILISGYIKLSSVYFLIVIAYSLGYSYYILILSRLLVK